MAKSNKPTNKDRDQAINTLMGNVNWLKNQFELIGRLFDAYVLYKGDQEGFMEHIEKTRRYMDLDLEQKNLIDLLELHK